MSHFTVLVIGPDVEGQLSAYDENIEVEPYRKYADSKDLEWYEKVYKEHNNGAEPENWQAVAAFLTEHWEEEYLWEEEGGIYQMSTYNPKSKWDWYAVGGRWAGFFKVKQGAVADVVRRGDVDAEAMRAERGETAGKRWDLAQSVFGDRPPAESWPAVLERVGTENIDTARAEYHAQPRVAAVKAHDQQCHTSKRQSEVLLGWDGGVEEFQVSRGEYVQRARDAAVCPYAYLKDGEWVAPGKMGWFGVSDEKTRFQREFNEMFDALPDDTLLTLCDCHI